jgi:hypothetical protein
MQLIPSQILRARLVRRTTKEDSEVPDGVDLGCLRLRRELADCHVLGHAPAQWADGLVGHGSPPREMRSSVQSIQVAPDISIAYQNPRN